MQYDASICKSKEGFIICWQKSDSSLNDYTNTIAKLKEEILTLKTNLSEKGKDEERLKDRIRGLEQKWTEASAEFTVSLLLEFC